jgi:hypothetical protein
MKFILTIKLILILFLLSLPLFAQDVNPLEEKRRREQNRALEIWRQSNQNPETAEEKKLRENRIKLRNNNNLSKIIRPENNQLEEDFNRAIAIDQKDLTLYEKILEEENTGIFRLLPDFDCQQTKVIKIGDKCAGYVPKTDTYSFRQGFHVTQPIHDLKLTNQNLKSEGLLSLGILAPLGDLPIEDVTLENKVLKSINDLKPAKKFKQFIDQREELRKGIKVSGDVFSNSAKVEVGKVYAIRIIAFRALNSSKLFRLDEVKNLKRTELNEVAGEFSRFDFNTIRARKRNDTVVVFKVVSQTEDGGITIVWKRLRQKRSPVINFK